MNSKTEKDTQEINLSNKELIQTLKRFRGLDNIARWVGDRDLETAWAECPYAEYMVFILAAINRSVCRKLILIAVHCIRLVYSEICANPMKRCVIRFVEAVEAWLKCPCDKTRQKMQKAFNPISWSDEYNSIREIYALYSAVNIEHTETAVVKVVRIAIEKGVNEKEICDYIRQTFRFVKPYILFELP